MKKLILGLLWMVCVPLMVAAQNTTESYYMMRAIEAAQGGDYNTAIEYLSKELDTNPKNGYAHMWTAIACAHSDRYGWALQYAQSALKLLPKKVKAGRAKMNILLADLYSEAKDTAQAITYLEQALRSASISSA